HADCDLARAAVLRSGEEDVVDASVARIRAGSRTLCANLSRTGSDSASVNGIRRDVFEVWILILTNFRDRVGADAADRDAAHAVIQREHRRLEIGDRCEA